MKLVQNLKVGNVLGEGVIWDHRRARFWWTDIEGSKLFRYDSVAENLESWQTPERLACLAPVSGRDDLVVAFASGFAFYQPETNAVDWIHKIESDNPGTRMNDGRTDRQGRFWAGSMTESPKEATYKGALYCLDHDLSLSKHVKGLAITNSLCWSPNGDTMYHCDTPNRTIENYTFNTQSGMPSLDRSFIQTDKGCYPDGSCIDADGFLWNAQWGGGKVVRYSPTGEVDLELEVPTSQPSCVAFGGVDLNLLCVTTARQDMSDEQLVSEPEAGNLLIYETDYRGLKDAEFAHSPTQV